MPFNGSGNYAPPGSDFPAVPNTLIESAKFNAIINDIATALSTCITKDGQTTVTANIPMGGYRFTGLGAGAANGQSLRYEQLFTTGGVQLLGAMNWVKGADVPSATTIDLTAATGNGVHITGTTAIEEVTLGSGMWRLVIFDGILTLTHDAIDNNLPGGANITTAAGDRAIYWSDGTTVYCALYQKANGKTVVSVAIGDITGLGTGIATALAVNVGSAGAPVINGGALGTPSGGDITNLAATQAQQETGSAVTAAVTPGRQQFHPSAAKGWAMANAGGGADASYNVSSITDGGTGLATFNWNVDFSGSSYCAVASSKANNNTAVVALVENSTFSAGSTQVATIVTTTGALADPNHFMCAVFGDQA